MTTPHAAALNWQHFPAGPNGFFRAPVLITGPAEAVLVDGGFTLSDGVALADAIKHTGKRLNAIYVSQSDPDYYFSLGPLKAAFPEARVIAAPETVAALRTSVEKKLTAWGPQLKENGPQTLTDVVIPDAFEGKTLTVDGHAIEIIDADGITNRRYLWAPSLQAIFGGVLLWSSRLDRGYTDQPAARSLDRQSGEDRSPPACGCRARPYGSARRNRYLRHRAHQSLSRRF